MFREYLIDSKEEAEQLLKWTLNIKPEDWQWYNGWHSNYYFCGGSNDVWAKPTDKNDIKGKYIVWFRKPYDGRDMCHYEWRFLEALKKYAILTEIKEGVFEVKKTWRPFN